MNKKKVVIVAGTRPEVIKVAPVYSGLLRSESLQPVLVSTGQHQQMLEQTLGVFELVPDRDLGLMRHKQTLADLTGRVISAFTQILREEQPAAVLVQGDTTTVLGAALASFYEKVPIGHVEAGLRTGNMLSPFPEEMNRRLTSPLARWNFCPTNGSRENLLKEEIAGDSCHVTGNTVVDSLLWVRDRLQARGVTADAVAERLNIPAVFVDTFLRPESTEQGKRWILVTGHRRESFGFGFERICEAINTITKEHPDVGILYPVHLNPMVREPVMRILGNNPQVSLIEPANYEDFIWLMDHCHFALSDSGGVQEEAPSLGKPVLVMRDTTERPEGVAAGTCTLVGTDPEKILEQVRLLLSNEQEYLRRSSLNNPYGDGRAAERICDVLEESLC
jgi:UDP-N-acetylglucosamine 2-epimerase (non-hydrolysing)